MKLNNLHINKIKASFYKLKDYKDLLILLNEVNKMTYGASYKPYKLKDLTKYSFSKNTLNHYTQFKINKKSGSSRIINSPVYKLKSIQKTLNLILQCVFIPHKSSFGFLKDRSIVENAKIHLGMRYVYNVDLKDFFSSIDQARVWKTLQLQPFNLNNNISNVSDKIDEFNIENGWITKKSKNKSRLDLANLIASLCCTELEVERKNINGDWVKMKLNVLPQGAPTSPLLSNVVCQKLDFLLTGVAKRFGLKYSRYADDITFSSMHNVYQSESEFLKELHRIIAEQNFHIKESKTRLQKDGYRKEVTGLLVNDIVNVQKRYIKQLRMWLYYWERYGYERSSGLFLQQYIADKGHLKNGKPDMANVISGKLNYLKMVKGSDNKLFKKLKGRFNILCKPTLIQDSYNQSETKLKRTTFIENVNRQNNKVNPTISLNSDIKLVENKIDNLYPIIHNPQKTVELLKYFTANDKDLKYSTHSWEEGKYENYEDFFIKIYIEWYEIKDELKSQSPRLHAKISSFLFNDKLGQKKDNGYHEVWGENRLKFGWSSRELKIHMEEPGNSPFSCPIPEQIKQLDKKLNLHYFKDYADVFKNEIEFREDSNNFKKMILEIWENELGYDFKLNGLEQLIGFSFFTDVALVKASVTKIFEMFKGKPHFPNILLEKISSFENGGYHLFRITQIDSFVTRSIDDPKITNPTGNLNTIIKQLENLSDYSIVSRFQDGNTYRINYLSSSNTSDFIEKLPENETVLGWTHELKFYL
jgi:RNA-directed DNA polymerase